MTMHITSLSVQVSDERPESGWVQLPVDLNSGLNRARVKLSYAREEGKPPVAEVRITTHGEAIPPGWVHVKGDLNARKRGRRVGKRHQLHLIYRPGEIGGEGIKDIIVSKSGDGRAPVYPGYTRLSDPDGGEWEDLNQSRHGRTKKVRRRLRKFRGVRGDFVRLDYLVGTPDSLDWDDWKDRLNKELLQKVGAEPGDHIEQEVSRVQIANDKLLVWSQKVFIDGPWGVEANARTERSVETYTGVKEEHATSWKRTVRIDLSISQKISADAASLGVPVKAEQERKGAFSIETVKERRDAWMRESYEKVTNVKEHVAEDRAYSIRVLQLADVWRTHTIPSGTVEPGAFAEHHSAFKPFVTYDEPTPSAART